MKNIHVLQTDKPSRLYFNTKAKYYAFSYTVTSQGGSVSNRHIYITSDEEIKEGDYWLNLDRNDINNGELFDIANMAPSCKKIILTTDQDLIKDGVQAIDDEFLEWFVKNPSCEFVEVKSKMNHPRNVFGYEIIIPKEEPKFEDSIENSLSIMSIANDMFGKKEEPKQEKICTGCGTFSSEELGKNKLGENFLACCPDSDYVNVQEYQEYGLLQHIKFCLESGNEAQAIRLIEKYGFEKQEQDKKMYSEEDMVVFGNKMQLVSDVDFDGNIKFAFDPSQAIKQFKNK